MENPTFEIYRRWCRSCLALFYTEHKHSRVCDECKLRTKHMREITLLKQKQKQELEGYLKRKKEMIEKQKT